MLSPEMLLNACLHEIKVIKHLATKMPVGGLRYRPSESQRTMLELMQYVSNTASMCGKAAIAGNWEHAEEYANHAKGATLENFSGRMDEQADELKATFEGVPSADWVGKDATLPWGQAVKLGDAMIMLTLQFLTAYRMQFFLYLKAAGATELSTANCWAGVDPAPAK